MMSWQRLKIKWVLFFLLTMMGCQSTTQDDELNGRITLWHSWSGTEAAILEDALGQFQEIHPDVQVITTAVPESEILAGFIEAGNNGLGPGLLIGEDSWIGELGDSGLIRPFSAENISLVFFNSRNRDLTLYQDKIHGMPMSLAPYALYYNTNIVDEPPESLDALLAEAAAGNQVAFVPRFLEAYWGIQAFGDGFIDDQGRFTLAESGFTEWLHWLNEAQNAPGVILNVDDPSLMELFVTGQIVYYVAGPDKQALIMAMMDEENPIEFGVVPLPQGPQGPAGPILTAETILLYAYTSDDQTKIANELASFLVNQQQSIRFMRELDRVPANPSVKVDRRIYPNVNGFAQQAKTAVVLPNEILTDPLIAAGNLAYITVLTGAATPEEAVCRFGLEVAEFQGYAEAEMSLPVGCEAQSGEGDG